jgi:hypothetical protein
MRGVLVFKVKDYPFIWLVPHLLFLLPFLCKERQIVMAILLYGLRILLVDAEYINIGWEMVMAPYAFIFPVLWAYEIAARMLLSRYL